MDKRLTILSGLLIVWCCALNSAGLAAALSPGDVPQPLQPWIKWAVFDDKQRECPFLYNSFKTKRCAWPSELRLNLVETQGEFSIVWQVFADSWIDLPGDEKYWPDNVHVNGVAQPVTNRNGKPAMYLPPGRNVLNGTFSWTKLPKSLPIPADTGIIELLVRGQAVDFPTINRDGQIWLSGAPLATAKLENAQTVKITRRIIDEIPMQIHTRIELDVTGEQRELVLGRPLLAGFIPISISSPLPARIESNGELRVQVRAGRHVIEIQARHPESLQAIVVPEQAAPWPHDETWAFDARNELRLVKIEGLAAIDPNQTQVPQAWRHLPVYAVVAGDVMRFNVIRRGNPDPESNKFTLSRRLWLDFDGSGYTTQDRINGTINRSWRLDSGPDLQLGQVVVDGQPRLISRRSDDGPDGVELRRARVNLVAEARMLRSIDEFSVVGWAHDFQSVEATLNLPPGWDVFAIDGVDNVPNTWLARWTLLDLFLVLVIAAAAARLWDRRVGAVALLALVLIWHAPDAPRYVWLSLFIAFALLRVLPDGAIRSIVVGCKNLTTLALIVITIPFAVHEFRLAAFPQLELPQQQMRVPFKERQAAAQVEAMGAAGIQFDAATMADDADLALLEGQTFAQSKSAMLRRAKAAPAVASGKSTAPTSRFAADPGAIIQTGPGLPEWQWKSLRLSWNGPVEQQQQVSITYITPPISALIHFMRVVMIGFLLWLVFGAELRRVLAKTELQSAVAIAACLMCFSLPATKVMAADFPDAAMLETLRQRLNEQPNCSERCADIARMRLNVTPQSLQIRLETHSAVASAIPLPGHAQQWRPQTVLVDGVVASALARDKRGTLWLQLPRGIHQVYLGGDLPKQRNVQIALPLRPHAVELVIDGWRIQGIRDDGQLEAQLQLTRLGNPSQATDSSAFEPGQLPPFIHVERTLRLGLDWTLTTKVTKVAAANRAAVFDVPLIAGESVVTPGVEVSDGVVRVNLGPRLHHQTWQSVLPKSKELTFTAPLTTEWLETWRLQASPMWHLEFAGIASVHQKTSGTDWLPQWRPWPGESVTFKVGKPLGAAGQSLTIDNSLLTLKPGNRATDSVLSMQIRSSKGGQYTLRLPAEANLQTVRINGATEALSAIDRELTIPIAPGVQTVEIEWRKAKGIATRFKSDALDLKIASINHRIEMVLGNDRWTLFTFGPQLGPAVRFWSLLGILLVVALALARLSLTPLTTAQWLLLAIGLSQVAVPLAAIVVLWLLALGMRERHGGELEYYRFNLAQIGLVVLSLAALLILVEAIRHGLLGHPDMHIAGNGSTAHQLRWYVDRVLPQTPQASVLSVPILVYRLLMLAWALWLALAILKWLRWGWTCFAKDDLWRAWRAPKDISASS